MADSEPKVSIHVVVIEGNVVLTFSHSVTSLSWKPGTAREMAQAMIAAADRIEGVGKT